ncbi:hypothetical protein B2J93_1616 [Marssonina coronariae]|uniref:Uncharacterized protein n=1 Tax=Diplocarpon coronariae TaxID=2795749 RepID=A0A218YWA0_9HELO|nr:hypothetical protein B2J93_1616 [Marssonina coronariae]
MSVFSGVVQCVSARPEGSAPPHPVLSLASGRGRFVRLRPPHHHSEGLDALPGKRATHPQTPPQTPTGAGGVRDTERPDPLPLPLPLPGDSFVRDVVSGDELGLFAAWYLVDGGWVMAEVYISPMHLSHLSVSPLLSS